MALELFGEDFKNELLEELVQLNVKAMTEAKMRVARGTNLAKDLKAGRCVRLEDESIDYSPYFNHKKSLTELFDWKNDTRREWVDMLTRAAEKETDSNVMRLLIKEANKLMKEVTK